ncbi:hypothetical protein [Chondrinema litorale]|uniref:hypothetical protein n=1 Tax=Chondrinema litorale TaxID=2994555 RepID=UPI002543004D|nr:hypothetical protein [Chondrinema litorale]UZR92538.1 hypothetical protein OQ292_11765 [Chondrinema litorale]
MNNNKIKYIFCITTGRSGSNYLNNIFSISKNAESFHEPHPIMCGYVMREYLNERITDEGFNQQLHEKVKKINLITAKDKIYIETNHIFIKSFGWKIMDFLDESNVAVIILRRDKEKVVDSYEKLKCTPLTEYGKEWMFTPADNLIIKKPSKFKYQVNRSKSIMSFFLKKLLKSYQPKDYLGRYLVDWYYDECYRQAELFKNKYKNISYLDININELNDIDFVENKVLKRFGIEYSVEDLKKVVSIKTNVKRPVDSLH